jgi:gluconate 2-dehydrogenase subunit 3-like protein
MSRTGTTPPGHAEPRFPGFDVLEQRGHWDETTAGVVLARLSRPDPATFHTVAEEAVARALLDHLLDQHDEPRVPVLELIDARLAAGQTDGWHYEDMPDDATAWKQSLAGLDADAQERCGQGFAGVSAAEQAALVQAVQDRGAQDWHGLRAAHVWSLWTRYACTAFYSHPWAWNEIGFSGPAYPRGYKNAGVDRLEPYERHDAHPHESRRATS